MSEEKKESKVFDVTMEVAILLGEAFTSIF